MASINFKSFAENFLFEITLSNAGDLVLYAPDFRSYVISHSENEFIYCVLILRADQSCMTSPTVLKYSSNT